MKNLHNYKRKKTKLTEGIYVKISERQNRFLKMNNIDIQSVIRDVIEDLIDSFNLNKKSEVVK